MRGGLCYSEAVNRRKKFLAIDDQVNLLEKRGLTLPSRRETEEFLKRQNYYRLSGYSRFFQRDPANGDERFVEGTHWNDIIEIYDLDRALRVLLLSGIQEAEIAARTAFALSEGEIHSPYEQYLRRSSYKSPKNPTSIRTHELIKGELSRSKEPYIEKYRRDSSSNGGDWHYDVPVWAAVEALSLGTLSKAISFRNDGNAVYERTAEILGTGKRFLTSQLRSFTFVRNKCAHSSRLWNCYVLDQPAVPDGVRRRAEKMAKTSYDNNSVLSVIVALDNFLYRAEIREGLLDEFLDTVAGSPIFRDGIASPRRS